MNQSLCTIFLTAISVIACAKSHSSTAYQVAAATYDLSNEIYATDQVTNPNGLDPNYISIGLPFAPANQLKKAVESNTSLKLNDRGEAHITLITPPEMQALIQKLSKKEVINLLEVADIQDETFNVVCLGRGRITSGAKTLETYFIVAASKGLVERRVRVEQAFLAKGGTVTQFSATHFFPHVTLGFTDRDLHESDGVIKDKNSCIAPLHMVP